MKTIVYYTCSFNSLLVYLGIANWCSQSVCPSPTLVILAHKDWTQWHTAAIPALIRPEAGEWS